MPIGRRWFALHDGWVCGGGFAATSIATAGGPSLCAAADVQLASRNPPS